MNHRTTEEEELESLKAEKLQRFNELEDIRCILKTKEGLRFFKRLFDEGKMFSTSMTGNSYTYYNEGQRNFVLKFFNDVCVASPETIPELILRKDK